LCLASLALFVWLLPSLMPLYRQKESGRLGDPLFRLTWIKLPLSYFPPPHKTKHLFQGVLTCFEFDNKTGVFKRSRRELFIDVAEHWSILKQKGVVRL